MTWAAVAVVGANIVGSMIQGSGASQAAGQQGQGFETASNLVNTNYGKAQDLLTNQYNLAQQTLPTYYNQAIAGYAPYTTLGAKGANALSGLIDEGYVTHRFNTEDLYNGLSPNYDFMLKQGQGTANAQANLGGGMIGGNAQQGLQKFTQDYASNAYQNAFNNYQSQRQNIVGNLYNISGLGLNAQNAKSNAQIGLGNALATGQTAYGNTGANLYANQGNTLGQLAIGGANAQAAGTLGQYDAYGNAISSSGNTVGTYMMLSNLNNKNSGGSSGNYNYNQPNGGVYGPTPSGGNIASYQAA